MTRSARPLPLPHLGPQASLPSITSVRSRVAELLRGEAARPTPRDVVVLAVDGVGFDVAAACWRRASLTRMQSVFPTTSSAAWLSSLTGAGVAEHGVPGVVFVPPGHSTPQFVLDHQDPLADGTTRSRGGNLFTDASDLGHRPIAVLGDLTGLHCSWRDLLLEGAQRIVGHEFFGDQQRPYRPRDAATLGQALASALDEALRSGDGPRFVWCFVELDRHTHHHGYDADAMAMLESIEQVCVELAEAGRVVGAYSDHGQLPTRNDPDLESLLTGLATELDFQLGGAGRTRWTHPGPTAPPSDRLVELLRARLPASVAVVPATDVVTPGSVLADRVGSVFLVATSAAFLAPAGYICDHGSWTPEEYEIPFAVWAADAA